MRPVLLLLPVVIALLAGCAGAHSSPGGAPHVLPPDSLALLSEALGYVRPGYPTQRDALRAGAYGPVAGRDARPSRSAAPFVIQIAAYGSRDFAEQARGEARRHFPSATIVIEPAGGVYRVALAGWPARDAAMAVLPRVQRIYPDAWLRRRSLP